MTNTDRVRLLLPLANGEELSEENLRRRLFRFLRGFQGRGFALPAGQQELWDVENATGAELEAVVKKVQLLFSAGLMFEHPPASGAEGITPNDVSLMLKFPSLRFGAFSQRRARPGAPFMLMVEAGQLRDLVSYLAMHLLTTEVVSVSRCTAPAFRDWSESCRRIFVGSGLGRPRLVCSNRCAARVKAKKLNERIYGRARKGGKREKRPPRRKRGAGSDEPWLTKKGVRKRGSR